MPDLFKILFIPIDTIWWPLWSHRGCAPECTYDEVVHLALTWRISPRGNPFFNQKKLNSNSIFALFVIEPLWYFSFWLKSLFTLFIPTVCDLVQSGVWALFGSSRSSGQLSWLLNSYAEQSHIPFLKLSGPSPGGSSSAFRASSYQFSLHPSHGFIASAILSLIESDGSNGEFTIFYQHNEGKWFSRFRFNCNSMTISSRWCNGGSSTFL